MNFPDGVSITFGLPWVAPAQERSHKVVPGTMLYPLPPKHEAVCMGRRLRHRNRLSRTEDTQIYSWARLPSVTFVPFSPAPIGAVHITQCREIGVRGLALFESNSASGSGGAFYGGSCDKIEMEEADFRFNYASSGGEN